MGLLSDLQSELADAFDDDLADAVYSFTCSKEVKSGTFDFETQTYPTVTTTAYSGRGVLFGSYAKELIKPVDYQVDDSKAIVLQNEVTDTPQINDELTTTKGVFKIISMNADPVSATYTLQLRKITA